MLKEISRSSKLFMPTPIGDKKLAILDIDDVIWPCTQILLDYFNNRFGTNHCIETNTNFHLEMLFPEIGTKDQLLHHLLHEVDYMCEGNFLDYAHHLIDSLVANNFFVAVVTSRGFHPEGYTKTFTMMRKQGLHFDAMGTTGMGQSKLDFVLDHIHEEPYVVLEDNVHVMKEFHDFGTKVVKFERPWNVDCSDHSHVLRPDVAIDDLRSLIASL